MNKLIIIRWLNIDIEEIESKNETKKYEVTYDITKHLEISSICYEENINDAIQLEIDSRIKTKNS